MEASPEAPSEELTVALWQMGKVGATHSGAERRHVPFTQSAAHLVNDYFEQADLLFMKCIHSFVLKDHNVDFHFKESCLNTVNLYSSSFNCSDS